VHALASSDAPMLDTLPRKRRDSAVLAAQASACRRAFDGRRSPATAHRRSNTCRPLADSLCGVTLAMGRRELLKASKRYSPFIEAVSPPSVEVLLVPIRSATDRVAHLGHVT
jgi:hypothetical protein